MSRSDLLRRSVQQAAVDALRILQAPFGVELRAVLKRGGVYEGGGIDIGTGHVRLS